MPLQHALIYVCMYIKSTRVGVPVCAQAHCIPVMRAWRSVRVAFGARVRAMWQDAYRPLRFVYLLSLQQAAAGR